MEPKLVAPSPSPKRQKHSGRLLAFAKHKRCRTCVPRATSAYKVAHNADGPSSPCSGWRGSHASLTGAQASGAHCGSLDFNKAKTDSKAPALASWTNCLTLHHYHLLSSSSDVLPLLFTRKYHPRSPCGEDTKLKPFVLPCLRLTARHMVLIRKR